MRGLRHDHDPGILSGVGQRDGHGPRERPARGHVTGPGPEFTPGPGMNHRTRGDGKADTACDLDAGAGRAPDPASGPDTEPARTAPLTARMGVVALAIVCIVLAACRGGEQSPAPGPASSGGAETASGPARNLVLVTLDTTRADRLGCYGARGVETPNLDALARRGVLFENAVSVAPLTLPAHCTMFTGLLPAGHGVRDNRGFRLAPERLTLAEVLKARGFATGGFVGAYVLDRRWGVAQGFDRYFDDFNIPRSRLGGLEETQRRGDVVVREGLAWVPRVATGRFFAWFHIYDPHAPYAPPEPYASRYAAAPYNGEIAWADELVGRILAGLAQSGVAGTTLVAVIGDHGESLGEHGESGHGFFLYEPSTRIPLILAGPGLPRGDGRRVTRVVGETDLAPTLLDLLGIAGAPPAPPLSEVMPEAKGRSLVPLALGRAAEWIDQACSETYYSRFHYGWSELRALRTDRYHFIEAPKPELYDLQKDPGETANLAPGEPQLVASLRAALAKLETTAGGSAATPVPEEEDEETLRKLAALGYAGSPARTRGKSFRDLPDPKDRLQVYNLLIGARDKAAAGALDAAIADLQKIVSIDPEVTDAWLRLGNCYSARKDYARAAENFAKALDRRPDYEYAFVGYTDALMSEGRTEDTISASRRFLQIDPQAALAHHQLGRALFRAKRFEDAEHSFSEALRLAPDLAEAAYDIGACREARADFSGSVAEFRRAIAIDPAYHEAHAALARRLFAGGDLAGAAAELRAALQYAPDNAVYARALQDLEKRGIK